MGETTSLNYGIEGVDTDGDLLITNAEDKMWFSIDDLVLMLKAFDDNLKEEE